MDKWKKSLIVVAIVFLLVVAIVLIGECAIKNSNLRLQQQKFRYEQQQNNKPKPGDFPGV